MMQMLTVAVTDSKNLDLAVQGSSLVEDAWLIPQVAIIKDAVEDDEISWFSRVAGGRMIADCLTKFGPPGTELMNILRTGKYDPPSEWMEELKAKKRNRRQ